MLKNFITIAIRSFFRQKFYSLINIIGLSTGLACVVFIYLWVHDELQMDTFHQQSDKIFRVVSNITGSTSIITWETTPGPLRDELLKAIPEVEYAARTMDNGDQLFQLGEKNFMESGFFADEDLFRIFSFPVVAGDATHPVPDKSAVAISQRLATKLFGNEDPIGKSVKVQRLEKKITAVFADIPGHSTLQFDFILHFDIYKEQRGDGFNFGNFDHPLYITLNNPENASAINDKINQHIDKLGNEDSDPTKIDFYMQPFGEAYLHAAFENGVPVGGRIKYVEIFTIVALVILLIACINYMNMATAKAATRAKEVGIRKVVGAQRKSLVTQFITESILLSTLSLVLAIGIVYLLLPLFNLMVSKNIVLSFSDPNFISFAIVIILITGLSAGSYPAFFLSSFRPMNVLKGTMLSSFSGAQLRRTLVLFQFALTVVLIASAIVVFQQVEFIRSKNLGYNRDATLTFGMRGDLRKNFNAFQEELERNPAIEKVARANMVMTQVNNQTSSVNWQGKAEDSDQYFRVVVVDYDLPELLDFTLSEGRFFSPDYNDTNNFVVTKRSVEEMGLTNPVGEKISVWGQDGTIVGVIDDFHSRSMHESIDPIVFFCKPDWTYIAYVHIKQGETGSAISQLEETHKKLNPEYPLEFAFLDDSFDRMYQTEKTIGSLAFSFTVMAIIISGLGLIGLAAYTAERKKKEISVRKTLGASVSGLVTMMCKEFVKISLIAAVIGCPVAYYLMDQFLQGYAYHTPLQFAPFIYTAGGVMLLALIIVITQVARAATANPMDALRNE